MFSLHIISVFISQVRSSGILSLHTCIWYTQKESYLKQHLCDSVTVVALKIYIIQELL